MKEYFANGILSWILSLFSAQLFMFCLPRVNTNHKIVFCLHLSLSLSLHPSLSAGTVYTLNKVKTAESKQPGFFDTFKFVYCWTKAVPRIIFDENNTPATDEITAFKKPE